MSDKPVKQLAVHRSHEDYEAIVNFWRDQRDRAISDHMDDVMRWRTLHQQLRTAKAGIHRLREMAIDHHADQRASDLLHVLIVDIPSMCESFNATLTKRINNGTRHLASDLDAVGRCRLRPAAPTQDASGRPFPSVDTGEAADKGRGRRRGAK
jgi:hypothetical protein